MRQVLAFLILGALAPAQAPPTFSAGARLVEIHATVLDRKGRHVPGLRPEHFEVLDNGKPLRPSIFESDGSALSLAVLIDTTGSMADALPRLKKAVGLLLDQLGGQDEVAIYGFDQSLEPLQPFTRDKRAARSAMLRTRAEGRTALFDALARVIHDAAGRAGRKAIVVFTDGDDNSSVLNLEAATLRARKSGIPVYTVAQGQALRSARLRKTLESIAAKSGALSFEVRSRDDMDEAFSLIAAEVRAVYLLGYVPPGERDGKWRLLQVRIASQPALKVRCKEGYYAE